MRPKMLTIQCGIMVILLTLQDVHSFRWLGINSTEVNQSQVEDLRRYLCSSSPRASRNKLLDKEQKKICRKKIRMMKYVVIAAELAKTECLRLTKYERWDCKAVLQLPKFSKDLRAGTREAAFLHALSSAALVFAITQGCTTDGVCDCGREPGLSLLQSYRRKHGSDRYTYAWRGCHDNIAIATRFSKDFLDRREVKKTKSVPRKVLNLHNNDLGRKVVARSLSVKCRCPGLQECNEQKCVYHLTDPFSSIAQEIFKKYEQAKKVFAEKAKQERHGMVLKFIKYSKKKKIEQNEMAYLKSQDFCLPDVKKGRNYPGTKGRVCGRRLQYEKSKLQTLIDLNPTMKIGFNVCKTLCCGRGFAQKIVIEHVRCRCRFLVDDGIKFRCRNCTALAIISICK
ncbi:protein Wnt-4-like isoform X1 [Xenia sp. Carnegie-2017]|uniref:protein Wnt-4-like isoform X1 n=1 Tax=Xenia sp. Carnegie-2017 TaxID=2897299 RepID=UPI001F043FC6|nr:protein Wnt-4-like isoform X1 [Xenia sp. Carnegie-2017]